MNELLSLITQALGYRFYYNPLSPLVSDMNPIFTELPTILNWPDSALIKNQCDLLCQPLNEDIEYHFSCLFEGQGIMAAPPWGSVYLDKDNLLNGDSTFRYADFLRQHHIEAKMTHNEPLDQFGLMLMVLSLLLQQNREQAAIDLLEQHILPWSANYLGLLKQATLTIPFYHALAIVTEHYLALLTSQLSLTPVKYELFKG